MEIDPRKVGISWAGITAAGYAEMGPTTPKEDTMSQPQPTDSERQSQQGQALPHQAPKPKPVPSAPGQVDDWTRK